MDSHLRHFVTPLSQFTFSCHLNHRLAGLDSRLGNAFWLMCSPLHNDRIVISTEGRNLLTTQYKRKISRRFAPRNDTKIIMQISHTVCADHLPNLCLDACFLNCFAPIIRSCFFMNTSVSGGTECVSHTLPPITERAPTTVAPPRIVALA